MFGKIVNIIDRILYVENLKKQSLTNFIGYHVVFEDKKKIVGEIIFVNDNEFQIRLLGEIKNSMFIPGIDIYPFSTATCRLVYKNELELIIGNQNIYDVKNILFGKSSIYDGFSITANLNDFFSNHFAVIGNTGSGKSCGVARILQNIFSENKKNPLNSHVIMFDAYGEYINSFKKINNHPDVNVKILTSKNTGEIPNSELIKIPPYLLDADDIAILLNIEDPTLIPTIEKTLKYVYIFKSDDKMCDKYKNDIVAKGFLEMLSSGKAAQQIRDQALAFLSKYNTKDINLETVIVQPGLNRTIRQCLNVDTQGKILALELLIDYVKKFSEVKIEQIVTMPTEYSLSDLYYALEFAIVSEGAMNNPSIYEKMNALKTRLHAIINSDAKTFFEYNEYVSRETYIKRLFMTPNEDPVQLIDVDFNSIDDRMSKILIKLMIKIFYKFSVSIEERGSFPINILIEEAHRYIQLDNDINIIGYNIFDRIAKEGRKYGLLLGVITQRLSELSSNVLSQCSNFVVFRMFYPDDIAMITSISSNVSLQDVEKVKSLRPGSALLFGSAFKIPLVTQFKIPNPMPTSNNINLVDCWYSDKF